MFEINPYASVVVESGTVTLTAPKAGEGLTTIHLTPTGEPGLFSIFSDLGEANFRYIDPNRDLSDHDRTTLIEAGFLVEPGSQAELRLFSCELDDFSPADCTDFEDLIVNPTYRFEPFDLTQFRHLSRQHLSPRTPAVYISTPITGLQLRISIPHDYAPEMAPLEAGTRLPAGFDRARASKLVTAGVLTSRERNKSIEREWNRRIEGARNGFQQHGYAVLRDMLPREYVRAMQRFYRAYVAGGFMPFSDPQVPLRYRQHNEPFAAMLHQNLSHVMSQVVGLAIRPSYSYAASYKPTAELAPHIDREQCEYSISLQIDYTPEPQDGVSPWPLFVEPLTDDLPLTHHPDEEWQTFFENDRPGKQAVSLANGDGLVYKGRELVHYRFPLPAGHTSTSIFLHYVPKDFEGDLD